jgi:hypothetical protein
MNSHRVTALKRPIANVRDRIVRPSKKAAVILAILLGTTLSAFFLGSTFGPEERASLPQYPSSVHETTFPRTRIDGSTSEAKAAAEDAATAAATSDSLKALASSAIWSLFASAGTQGQSDGDLGEAADAYFERMVIFTAVLRLEVGDIDSAVEGIRLSTEEAGGFIAGVSTSKGGGGIVTVRVPQVRFYDVIREFEALGEVEEREVKGEDISETYVDLEARLANLQREEGRLVEILDLAVNVEEVLKVEAELSRVRGEIEGITGEMKYIEGRVELATITVSLVEESAKERALLPQVDWWAPVNTGLQALATVTQGLLAMAIFLGPFVAVGVPTYILYKRGVKGKNAPLEEAPLQE